MLSASPVLTFFWPAFARGLLALGCLHLAASELRPGYEDELYCPRGSCLLETDYVPDDADTATAFYQCASVADGSVLAQPLPWGRLVDDEAVRAKYIADGLATPRPCESKQAAPVDPTDRFASAFVAAMASYALIRFERVLGMKFTSGFAGFLWVFAFVADGALSIVTFGLALTLGSAIGFVAFCIWHACGGMALPYLHANLGLHKLPFVPSPPTVLMAGPSLALGVIVYVYYSDLQA
jgi:hypothetical protein